MCMINAFSTCPCRMLSVCVSLLMLMMFLLPGLSGLVLLRLLSLTLFVLVVALSLAGVSFLVAAVPRFGWYVWWS